MESDHLHHTGTNNLRVTKGGSINAKL